MNKTFTSKMRDRKFIGCYWASRPASREECAKRIADSFAAIHDIEYLSSWFAKGRKHSPKPIDVSASGIEKKLQKNKSDTDGSFIDELGFSLSAWNGLPDHGASFAILCGSCSKFVGNSLVIDLPETKLCKIYQYVLIYENILSKLIDIWEPDHALLTSGEYIGRNGGGMPWEAGGWLSYKSGGEIIRNL